MLRQVPLRHYLLAACVVGVAALISALLGRLTPLPSPTFSLIFLTGVLVVAARTSLPVALAAAVMSSLAFNFFFLEPQFGFSIYGGAEIVATLLFLVVAVIGGHLANRLRAQVAVLQATNQQSQALLALSKRLAGAPDAPAACRIAVEMIAAFERAPACLLTSDFESGELALSAAAPGPVRLAGEDRAAADWAFEHDFASGFTGEPHAVGTPWRFVPLWLNKARYGVLGVRLAGLPNPPSKTELLLLDAIASQVTLTLARTELTANLAQTQVAEDRERLRSALLSSVSHDLRTPLASIIGSASTLRDFGERLSEADKVELLDAVVHEGERLDRYVENLLDMTRLGQEPVKLERDWVTLEDIVAACLHRLRSDLAGLRVVRDIPPNLPLLYIQPALIEQALVNIVENAARFSPPAAEIRISGRRQGEELLIRVADEGPGIPASDLPRVFEMFFSSGRRDSGPHGSGLGLTICHGIVEAHDGSIEAMVGPDGSGTTIAMRLPLHDLPEAFMDDSSEDHVQ